MWVFIQNKAENKRVIPTEYVLGEYLSAGINDSNGYFFRNTRNALGFTAYLPERMGRGINITWIQKNADSIMISLRLPAPDEEIDAFFDMIGRILDFWDADITVGGFSTDRNTLMNGRDKIKARNRAIAERCFNDLFQGKRDHYTLECINTSLTLGMQEAMRFRGHFDMFIDWLHEKQNMGVQQAFRTFL